MDTKVIDTIKSALENSSRFMSDHADGIFMAVISIIVISTIIALALVFRHKKFMEWLSSRFGALKYSYSSRSKTENRLAYLERCMENLIKKHLVLSKMEDSYEYIDYYAEIKNDEERGYCQKYLLKQYGRSFRRYDDDRKWRGVKGKSFDHAAIITWVIYIVDIANEMLAKYNALLDIIHL